MKQGNLNAKNVKNVKKYIWKKKLIQVLKRIEQPDDNDYLIEALKIYPFIKKESFDIVLQHLQGKINLAKTGKKLTVAEKKYFGINPRLSVTNSLVNVLTDLGLKETKPREVLSNILNIARRKQYIKNSITRFIEADIKQFTLLSVDDERECSWCKLNANTKMSVTIDINKLIKENCTCKEGSRLALQAVVRF